MLLRPYQTRAVNNCIDALRKHKNTLLVAATGSGKCLAKGTPVMMFDGTVKPVECVDVGDSIMGPDSRPRTVCSLARGEEEMFRISPTKGEPFTVNKSHILSLVISGKKSVSGYGCGKVVNISISDYLKETKTFRHCAKGWRAGVDFEPHCKNLPVPPYMLGVWLGDGGNRGVNSFANPDKEIIAEICSYAESIGLRVRHEYYGDKCPMHYITSGKRGVSNQFKRTIKGMGLSCNKHIPLAYKTSSRQDRLEILAGLLDTDGHYTHGGYDFISKDKALSQDVVFVSRSLGLAAYISDSWKKCQTMSEKALYHRVSISGDCSIIPCRVERKKSVKRSQKKDALRFGFSIESIGHGEYFGFEIEGPDRLFLLGDFTVTHNTIILSSVVEKRVNGTKRALVLQHRDELVSQNAATFRKVSTGTQVSFFTAGEKNWRGQVTFGMIQTIANHIEKAPKIDLLVVDECHHLLSNTYQIVIAHTVETNPDIEILGVTATPERSDRKNLGKIFSNVADVIGIPELIQAGYLTPPRALVVDIGTQSALSALKPRADDYSQAEVEAIQNTTINNNQVVEKWLDLASERQTVVFSSTVQHALDVRDTFREMNVTAEAVYGDMPIRERRAVLAAYERGDVKVVVNPMLLTEGFDDQQTSCVMLLRISSHKSTMIQMIGRGLRKLDPRRYPGKVKKECLVMDFGISILKHGDLNADVRLRYKDDDKDPGAGGKKKTCPNCQSELPVQTRECQICGYEFKIALLDDGFYNEIEELKLIEIDLINASPFRWISIFESEMVLMATGFESWACVCTVDDENWFAIGGRGNDATLLTVANKIGAIASADDFMRCHEKSASAKKAASWMRESATQKQMQLLARFGHYGQFTKVEAGALLTFEFNSKSIEKILGVR